MLVIRLRRIGQKSHPTYRIVVAEHTAAVQGSFVADLGFYNPHTKQTALKLDEIKDWLDKGAKPSNTVAKVLEKEKIKHRSVVVTKFKKAPKQAADEKTSAPATANPAVATEKTVEAVAAPIEVDPEPVVETAEEVALTAEPTTEAGTDAASAETESADAEPAA